MASNVVLSTKEYKVVGTRPIRHDGYDKVTGKAQYGADVSLPGMLHGKVLRSPHAHARIVSIDTSRAEAHPDVEAVATSADLADAGGDLAKRQASDKILAGAKALYKGHPIAAVAASTPHVAEEALALIDVEYEVLPAVTDVDQATAEGAPLLHDEYEGNVESHDELSIGDMKAGFEQADVIVEREFTTKTVHQGYIEPHSATAWWLPNDRITLWQSSQGHFQIGEGTAAVLGIPASSIKVIPLEIGGGFGGKTLTYLEPIACVLSRKSGRPVKLTMTRTEVMEATGPTSGTYQKVRMGATNDGKLVAAEATLKYEAGAFPGSPAGAAAQCMFTPYDIENVYVDFYSIVDNKPSTAAYRAPGAPSGSFSAETVVDELCEKLGMDPPGVPADQRGQGGHEARHGTGQPGHRLRRDDRGHQDPRPLDDAEARGPERRPRRGVGLLDKRRRGRLRHRERELGRHREPDDRLHGHRRHAAGRGAAVR